MEAFDKAISFWVVGRGRVGVDAPRGHQLIPRSREKLAASIRRDGRWNAVVSDPAMGKCI